MGSNEVGLARAMIALSKSPSKATPLVMASFPVTT